MTSKEKELSLIEKLENAIDYNYQTQMKVDTFFHYIMHNFEELKWENGLPFEKIRHDFEVIVKELQKQIDKLKKK